MSTGKVRIGISGWRYPPWRGVFYPPKLPQRRELEFASRLFPSIELNGSFYGLQRPAWYAAWRDDTPEDFVFAVKAHKFVTHVHRLKDVREPIANFLASGLLELQAKLGPILWQFPPSMRFNPERFEEFFAMLPHDTEAAAELAKEHRLQGPDRASTRTDAKRPVRHAVEIRHPSFVDEDFVALLRRHRVALVVADTAGRWPLLEDLCTDFMYLRLHGDEALYASGYGPQALDRWAERIATWRDGGQVDDARLASTHPAPERRHRDVYCYFDNDVKVHAPYDAAALTRRLGLPTVIEADKPTWPPGWKAPALPTGPLPGERRAPR